MLSSRCAAQERQDGFARARARAPTPSVSRWQPARRSPATASPSHVTPRGNFPPRPRAAFKRRARRLLPSLSGARLTMSGQERQHQPPGARAGPPRDQEAARLQEELKSLEQMHSSLRALHQMVASCNETINSLVHNNNTLTDMNKGWQIFFTGQRGDLKSGI
ncbi:uncharacterized protein RBU57_003378 isoform 2-T2 [Macrochelys suwanniensis]